MITIYRPLTKDQNCVNEIIDAIIGNLNEVKTPSHVHDRIVNLTEAKTLLDGLYETTQRQVQSLDDVQDRIDHI